MNGHSFYNLDDDGIERCECGYEFGGIHHAETREWQFRFHQRMVDAHAHARRPVDPATMISVRDRLTCNITLLEGMKNV